MEEYAAQLLEAVERGDLTEAEMLQHLNAYQTQPPLLPDSPFTPEWEAGQAEAELDRSVEATKGSFMPQDLGGEDPGIDAFTRPEGYFRPDEPEPTGIAIIDMLQRSARQSELEEFAQMKAEADLANQSRTADMLQQIENRRLGRGAFVGELPPDVEPTVARFEPDPMVTGPNYSTLAPGKTLDEYTAAKTAADAKWDKARIGRDKDERRMARQNQRLAKTE